MPADVDTARRACRCLRSDSMWTLLTSGSSRGADANACVFSLQDILGSIKSGCNVMSSSLDPLVPSPWRPKSYRLFLIVALSYFVTFVSALGTTCSSPLTSGTAAPSDPYWLQNIKHQGTSAFNSNPGSYKVFRNVKDFGAVGNGVSRVCQNPAPNSSRLVPY